MDIRKLVRRAERDPWNRLNSIFEDADWVNSFCKSKIPHLPVIPNLRCGAWYVPDGLDKGCYFKSTDGHTTQWDFSLKRYNLDLVYLIQEKGGCAIVDSTRRGKSMSDALSKTIPIWCAVLNAASNHRHGKPQPCLFRLSQYVVSPSEEAQISAKIDGWVEMLLDSDLDVPLLEKPLQPLFVTRARHDEGINSLCAASTPDFYPIVLVSASQMVPTPGLEPMQSPIRKSSLNLSREIEILRQKSQYIYVQGSGDDEEMWSFHLTPSMFWNPAHLQRILSIGHGNNLEDTLRNIVLESKSKGLVDGKGGDIECNGFNIFLGTRHHTHIFSTLERQSYALIVHCDGPKNVSAEGEGGKEEEVGGHVIRLGIPLGKKGRAAFRDAIPLVVTAARSVLPRPILICSQENGVGNDLAGGLLISVLSCCFDEDRQSISFAPPLTKDDIRRRLQWTLSILPSFTPPSRGHMLRINEVLLSGPFRDDNDDTDLVRQMAALSSK